VTSGYVSAPRGQAQGGEIARSLTVLLADSDPAARHVLRRVLLREFKSVVLEADNGIAALEGLDTGGVDALVLDLKIPTLGGLDVLRDIRQSPRLSALPVVVITEQKEEATVKEALALGVSDYVLKDQHQAVIVERLRRVFSSGRQLGPMRPQVGVARGGAMSSSFTVLVVDEDADFRHFANEVFRSKYEVTTTASAAQAMTLSMTQAPNVILVGTSIGTMSQSTFVRRIRQIDSLSETKIVGVVPRTGFDDANRAGIFDKVVVRSFVPETFMQHFEQIVGPPGVLAKVVAVVPGFRAQSISAVEQVFGMMLGTEVNILDEVPAVTTGAINVGVPITLADQGMDIVVAAIVDESTGLALAGRMLQSAPDDLPSDASTSALSEILNMVAGRILHGLTNSGLRAHIGLPTNGAAREFDPDAIKMGFAFESLTGELKYFSFSISEKESSAEKSE
jgi:CheY-like chemotaxis protein